MLPPTRHRDRLNQVTTRRSRGHRLTCPGPRRVTGFSRPREGKWTQGSSAFFCFDLVWGPYPRMLRAYDWLCTQKLFLLVGTI